MTTSNELIVSTSYGKLLGMRENGVVAFKGIPHARPPVGPLRFRPPEPPAPWDGIRDATRFGPVCPQVMLSKLVYDSVENRAEPDEDCLYLNVWTPSLSGSGRPVLVWVHGGGYWEGSGSSSWNDGALLARRGDAVIVTFNYRLGVLGGFLDLSRLAPRTFGHATNAGILDQVSALRWVRENIEAFGGDPDNVTLFGLSAGGWAVGALLGTPAARGLFDKAIVQSGPQPFAADRERSDRVAAELCRELALSPEEAGKIAEIPLPAILEAQRRMILSATMTATAAGEPFPFKATIDGTVIPESPIEAVVRGHLSGVRLMIGSTRDEWGNLGITDLELRATDDRGLLARLAPRLGTISDTAAEARRLLEAYRAATRARGENLDPFQLFVRIETDRTIRVPAISLADAHSASGGTTFAYLFCMPGAREDLGSVHALDLPLWWGLLDLPDIPKMMTVDEGVERLAVLMQNALFSFARTGDPGSSEVEWPRYTTTKRETMMFDRESWCETDPHGPEREAWASLFDIR